MSRIKRPRVATCLVIAGVGILIAQTFVACVPDGNKDIPPMSAHASIATKQQSQAKYLDQVQLQPDGGGAMTAIAPTFEEWRESMRKTPRTKIGCFVANYPDGSWREVPCGTAPTNRNTPRLVGGVAPNSAAVATSLIPEVNGSGQANFGAVTTSPIAEVNRSFPRVSGVTSETDNQWGSNMYSLQVNSNWFPTQLCNGAQVPGNCSGWQQWVYNSLGQVHMEYWLNTYVNNCPTGWSSDGKGNCVVDGPAGGAPVIAPANLAQVTMDAFATSTTDTVSLWVGTTGYSSTYESLLGLGGSNQWQYAEFNVFGYGNKSTANFNAGSTITVQTQMEMVNGSFASPTCWMHTTTAESNNLNYVADTCCPIGGYPLYPAIQYVESNAASAAAPFCLLNQNPIEELLLL